MLIYLLHCIPQFSLISFNGYTENLWKNRGQLSKNSNLVSDVKTNYSPYIIDCRQISVTQFS